MKGMVTAVSLGMLVVSGVAVSEALELKGTQVRGVPGRNAQIKSTPVHLTKPARIVRIEGGKEGLCIQGPTELCGTSAELTGRTLLPGSYTAYPNLPKGVNEYSVTVELK